MDKIFWIADDDSDDRMIIREAFEENNYNHALSFFEDGEKVLLKLKENDETLKFPSLLILDLNMPRINGLELLSLVKKDARTQHIPVVILSTSKNIQDKDKVMSLGADDFITKPFSFDLMIQITRDLIIKYG